MLEQNVYENKMDVAQSYHDAMLVYGPVELSVTAYIQQVGVHAPTAVWPSMGP